VGPSYIRSRNFPSLASQSFCHPPRHHGSAFSHDPTRCLLTSPYQTLQEITIVQATDATALPVDDLAHRDAPDAPTRPVAAHAVARTTAALNAARAPPKVVRKVQEATNRTVLAEELHRDLSRTRVK